MPKAVVARLVCYMDRDRKLTKRTEVRKAENLIREHNSEGSTTMIS